LQTSLSEVCGPENENEKENENENEKEKEPDRRRIIESS